jgi:SAM-dependent methyltransferase
MLPDIFRCPLCKGPLAQTRTELHCQRCERAYEIFQGIPDLYLAEGESAIRPDDLNRKWLDAQIVEGRDLYYNHCARQLAGMGFCMDEISRRTFSGCRVLEIGSGTGHFTQWLAEVCQPGTEIYAFDFSWPCIEKTRIRIKGSRGLILFRANARGPVPFARETFDLIFQRLAPFNRSGATPQEKTRRILELLKPGGWHIFAGWGVEWTTCGELVQGGFARAEHHRWEYPYVYGAEEYLAGLVEGLGSFEQAKEALARRLALKNPSREEYLLYLIEGEGRSAEEAEEIWRESQFLAQPAEGFIRLRKEHLFMAQKSEV